MLTFRHMLSRRPLTLLTEIMLVSGLLLFSPNSRAEDPVSMNLLFEPEQAKDYSYRQVNHDKTIHLMLYGLKDSPAPEIKDNSLIPKDKKALNAFFKQHWESIRHDYLGDKNDGMNVVAGEESFASKSLNENIGMDNAKMVGLTIPIGKATIGGGYTWGEKNPALMLKTTEGFFAGASYDIGRTNVQVSYLTSGQEVLGLEAGGTDINYSSILVGTSFRVNRRMGLTATMQYRHDDDPLTTGNSQAVFTVGTKWKF